MFGTFFSDGTGPGPHPWPNGGVGRGDTLRAGIALDWPARTHATAAAGAGLGLARPVRHVASARPTIADFTLVADRAYLNQILIGEVPITGEMASAIEAGALPAIVAIMAAIDSGDIRIEGGSAKDLQRFFGYFDEPVDVGAINLIVR